MAIPFFSIDFRGKECAAFLKGLIPIDNQGDLLKLTSLIAESFDGYEVILFPSARMSFFMTLQELFEKGDEIIFPVLGFPLYVKMAVQLGLKPKLVDVEKAHLTINPDELEKTISEKTKGIVVTHLFGHPAQMDKIQAIAQKHGIPLIEDCAQSYDSFFKGKNTGTFGHVGIFSCSLMKVPTTLGGGVMITKDKGLADKIRKRLEAPSFSNQIKHKFAFFVKSVVSILNSYPVLYDVCSHRIFGLIKNRNPAVLRKILYSGMGLASGDYNLWERPRLAKYQIKVGLAQFPRTREMTMIRKAHSKLIDEAMSGTEGVQVLRESPDAFWNYQYHVVVIEDRMHRVFDEMFRRGIHLMKEDVWDCSQFDFYKCKEDFPVGSKVNKGLIRIPNNSLLNKKQITQIAEELSYCSKFA